MKNIEIITLSVLSIGALTAVAGMFFLSKNIAIDIDSKPDEIRKNRLIGLSLIGISVASVIANRYIEKLNK